LLLYAHGNEKTATAQTPTNAPTWSATRPGEAAELANLAGKMIGSAKVQVEYYALRKEAPTIEFLRATYAD